MARIRVVVFLGPVGVGKSTQVGLLRANLSDQGAMVTSTFLKSGHLFSYFLLRMLARGAVGEERRGMPPIGVLIDQRPSLYRRLFGTWLALDLLSVVIKFLFAIYLPMKSGFMVLVEEGIPATVADYLYLCSALELPREKVFTAINLLSALHARMGPKAIVVIDANPATLKSRSIQRGSFIEREDYVSAQRELLPIISRVLAGRFLLSLDTTSKSIRETSDLILKWLATISTA
jgi:hypothetical protein